MAHADASRLGVVPFDLFDKHGQRGESAEPGVGTSSIVGVQPARQRGQALDIGAEDGPV